MRFLAFVSAIMLGSKITEVVAQEPWIHSSTYPLPQSEKDALMGMTNTLRDTIKPKPINLPHMVYNDTFDEVVTNFLNARDSDWVFGNDPGYNNTLSDTIHPMNGLAMLQRPEFKDWAPYCTFWLHDTNNPDPTTSHGQTVVGAQSVQGIFHYRLKQTHCFDWSACTNNMTLPNFRSCIYPLSQAVNGKPCAYAKDFLVRMLLPFDSAVVIGINHKGPFTPSPKIQLVSFWGWACSSKGIKNIPTNGHPYEIVVPAPTTLVPTTEAPTTKGRKLLRNVMA